MDSEKQFVNSFFEQSSEMGKRSASLPIVRHGHSTYRRTLGARVEQHRWIMNNLSKSLDNFWMWAQISENDYLLGIQSPTAKQAEWEENYPDWRQIEEEFDKAIEDQNKNWNEELSDLMIIAIALDHEDGLLFEQCSHRLNDFTKFISRCINSKFEDVRIEIALRINDLPLTLDLIDRLKNDNSEMVRKFASETNN